ncbi:MAG: MATE family efflux transporter [Planctomycetes bacterium]|nr:MATE family efflux transporter [Planctomycetota bacterium]
MLARYLWRREGGYGELLVIAIPLVLSTSSWTIQRFVDRMFLTWYSQEAIAAVLPAGILSFSLLSVFLGTAAYVGTFVAQYHGAGQKEQVGAVIWQGMYIALLGGIFHLMLIPFSQMIFDLIGHAQELRCHEVPYFRILRWSAFASIACSSMGGFYSGRGRTWPILWVNVSATVVNTICNYVLIFGKCGFPRMGVSGAALGTVISQYVSLAVYVVLLSQREHNKTYRTMRSRSFRPALFLRLLRFGLPNGLQFFIDIAGITVFTLLIGRLGKIPAAATAIAFNINMLAFMPMIGIGIGVSVTVGKYQGMGRPHLSARSVWSGFTICILYMSSMAAAYIFLPWVFIAPFATHADPRTFGPVRDLTTRLLQFVALYSVFDTLNIIFASGLKGAGDTLFVMIMVGIVSVVSLIIPSFIFLLLLGWGIYTAWLILTVYVTILGFAFLARFLRGSWRAMKVIEERPPSLPATLPPSPGPELDP